MHYFIDIKYTKGDLVIDSVVNFNSFEKKLENSEAIELELVKLKCSHSRGKKNDFLISPTVILPFVSEKVKRIIDKLDYGFQFFKTTISGYYLMHTLTPIKAFDWENSVYKRNPPFLPEVADLPMEIEKLVFNKTIENIDIFRMYEESVSLFISEKLKNIFENEGITGIRYVPISEYTCGVY